jgi:hypothetical protein
MPSMNGRGRARARERSARGGLLAEGVGVEYEAIDYGNAAGGFVHGVCADDGEPDAGSSEQFEHGQWVGKWRDVAAEP